jgi:hemerythrin-like domain-containing protein
MSHSYRHTPNETIAEPDDAIAILRAEHRQVRTLFQQYADTSDPYLQQIIAEHIFAELTLHMVLEEVIFYPVFAEQSDEAGKQIVSAALQEHLQVRDLIAALQEIDDEAAFASRFAALREHVDQHIQHVETTMLPLAAQVLAVHLEEITVLMRTRKAQLLAS